jgi:hypothetical protein
MAASGLRQCHPKNADRTHSRGWRFTGQHRSLPPSWLAVKSRWPRPTPEWHYCSTGIFSCQCRLDQQFKRLPYLCASLVRTLNMCQRRFEQLPHDAKSDCMGHLFLPFMTSPSLRIPT